MELIAECVYNEQSFLDFHMPYTREKVYGSDWNFLVEILSENLCFKKSEHFYNLG